MPSQSSKARETLVRRSIYSRLLEARSPDIASLALLKQDVARDLADLLNSRRIPEAELIAAFPEAERSIVGYGLPDLLSFGATNFEHQEAVRLLMEETIEQFEPRLGLIAVALVPLDGPAKAIHFRIDARLTVPPFDEPVTFDAQVDISSHECVVKES